MDATDECETRWFIFAATPAGDEYVIIVAHRGTPLVEHFYMSGPLAFVIHLFLTQVRPTIGRRTPVRKVGVYHLGRLYGRKRLKCWVPSEDDAATLAVELREEIERGHLRWEEREAR